MKVSICIPTYNRPELLLEALESCINQTCQPFEILIGDDSDNDETANIVEKLKGKYSFKVRYFHNQPSLKQSKNIKNLFSSVKGDKIVLLHDDDLLLPEAIKRLMSCFKRDPEIKVAFGKQYIIDEDGAVDYLGSEFLNSYYFRTKKYIDNHLTPLESGFLQQFPNDGYMLDASVLQKINYRTTSEIGDLGYGSEYDFGVQIGRCGFKMHFTDEYLCKYRRSSNNSISSSTADDAALKSFLILRNTKVPISSVWLKEKVLMNKVSMAVKQAVIQGNRNEALKLFFSKWHRNKIFTPGGLKRFILILFPQLFLSNSK